MENTIAQLFFFRKYNDKSLPSEEELKKHNTLPRDAAEILVRGMEAGKWKIIIGKDCKQMDWMMRIAPKFTMKKMAAAMKKVYHI